jgi:fructoselysine-6-P-deglycase FrlB-like protein
VNDIDPGLLGRQTRAEIESQPSCWVAARELAGAPGLPVAGERVLVLGCGTSYYVGGAYAWLREQSGAGVTDALIASELPAVLRDYDRVIAISRSGTSAELVAALDELPAGLPVTALLGELGTPVGDRADDIVDLSFADEQSVVQTRFPTTQLALLLTSLGEGARVQRLIDDADALFAAPPTESQPRQLVVLGTGAAAFLAQEAALKARESVGMWAEAYASGEYLHGPISVAGEDTLVWAMTGLSDNQREAILGTGARLHETPDDPILQLVQIQRHAVRWAAERGRDADRPVHLSRSVLQP